MALTNHERVGKALELLKTGLLPFIERELKAKYGNGWAFEVKDILSDTRLAAGKGESLQDVAASLVVMDRKWTEVFRQILGKSERSLVNELLGVRNAWAHQEPFSSDDAYRALDSAGRLLSAVSAAQADDVDKMKMELLRVRFDEQARSEKRKSASTASRERRGRQPQALARSGDAACRRGQRSLPAGRVRRRSVAGASGRGDRRIQEPGRVLPPHLPDRKPEGDAGRRGAAPHHRPRRPGGAVADQLRRRQDALDAGALPPVLGHRADRAGRHRRSDVRRGRQQDSDRPARGAGGQQDFSGQPVDQARRHACAYAVGRTGLAAWRQTGVRAAGRRRRESDQPRRRAARAVQRLRPVRDPGRRVGGLCAPTPRPERPARRRLRNTIHLCAGADRIGEAGEELPAGDQLAGVGYLRLATHAGQ
jgi:hypothetical protein